MTYQWNSSPTSVSAPPTHVSVTASSAYSHDSDSFCTHDAFHAAVKSSRITIWITKNTPDPTRAAHSVFLHSPPRDDVSAEPTGEIFFAPMRVYGYGMRWMRCVGEAVGEAVAREADAARLERRRRETVREGSLRVSVLADARIVWVAVTLWGHQLRYRAPMVWARAAPHTYALRDEKGWARTRCAISNFESISLSHQNSSALPASSSNGPSDGAFQRTRRGTRRGLLSLIAAGEGALLVYAPYALMTSLGRKKGSTVSSTHTPTLMAQWSWWMAQRRSPRVLTSISTQLSPAKNSCARQEQPRASKPNLLQRPDQLTATGGLRVGHLAGIIRDEVQSEPVGCVVQRCCRRLVAPGNALRYSVFVCVRPWAGGGGGVQSCRG